jgi:hypothetical protein
MSGEGNGTGFTGEGKHEEFGVEDAYKKRWHRHKPVVYKQRNRRSGGWSWMGRKSITMLSGRAYLRLINVDVVVYRTNLCCKYPKGSGRVRVQESK